MRQLIRSAMLLQVPLTPAALVRQADRAISDQGRRNAASAVAADRARAQEWADVAAAIPAALPRRRTA